MRIASVMNNNFAHLNDFYGCEGVVITSPEELKKDDIVLLHGGGDISPTYYNDKKHKFSYASETPSNEDIKESMIIDKAISLGLRLFGICRGAQWLCIKAGGKLVQHIDGHSNGNHPILLTESKEVIWSNSSHHQMMDVRQLPAGDREILAVGIGHSNKFSLADTPIIMDSIEAVWFPKINGFATQGHPEWLPFDKEYVQWCLEQSKHMWEENEAAA